LSIVQNILYAAIGIFCSKPFIPGPSALKNPTQNNSIALDDNGYFYLTGGSSNGIGNSFITKLKDTTSNSSLDIDHLTPINLKKGWNLISNPITKPIKPKDIFSNYSAIYLFINNQWIDNDKIDTIEPNLGFWINSNIDTTITFNGENYTTDFTIVKSGWNLLGTGKRIDNPMQSGNFSSVYKYNNGWKKDPDIIESGEGYWGLR